MGPTVYTEFMPYPTTRIMVLRPDGSGGWAFEVALGVEHKIGGDATTASIHIPDSTNISPEHALLTIGTEGIKVRDLDSKAGTFIMDGDQTLRVGNRVSVPLKPHQELWLGNHYFFQIQWPSPPITPPSSAQGMAISGSPEAVAVPFTETPTFRDAKEGNADAQNRLGDMYCHGQAGAPRNLNEAEKWYQKAAEQGHLQGMFNLLEVYSPTAVSQVRNRGFSFEQLKEMLAQYGVRVKSEPIIPSSRPEALNKITIFRSNESIYNKVRIGPGEHTIGSDQKNDAIWIGDHNISSGHALLIIEEDEISVQDLNSQTGTYIVDEKDSEQVRGNSPVPLLPHQKLWIGENFYLNVERKGIVELKAGSRLGNGRFILIKELGSGGMGAVWLAQDAKDGQQWALKLVKPKEQGIADTTVTDDLKREVKQAQGLNHENIVNVGSLWEEANEPPFITMEYVDGTNLHEVRKKLPNRVMSWSRLRKYMLQLCAALEYAHVQRVIHRDIKPANLMLDWEDHLKLADFGIASTLVDNTSSFMSKTVLGSGTLVYMSPQQLDGERPRVTDDIYSVGATIYELLTSTPPFYQGDVSGQARHTEPTSMAERLKELGLENAIPNYVEKLVMACLQKKPTKRPMTMLDVRQWIETGGREKFTFKQTKIRIYISIGAMVVALILYKTEPWFGMGKSTEELYWEGEKAYRTSDYSRAAKLWLKAAMTGHPKSQFRIGILYESARGVAWDDKKATKWWLKAAEQGHVKAQHNLGWMYIEGRGVPKDPKEAAKWWTKAANKEFVLSQFRLGVLHQTKDPILASFWYRKAAERGYFPAQSAMAKMRFEENRFSQAAKWAMNAVRENKEESEKDAEFQLLLGRLYFEGIVVKKDQKAAFQCFQRAAVLNNVEAMVELGIMYRDGLGGSKNFKQAFELFSKAAGEKNPSGQFHLGVLYYDGKGVDRDFSKAAALFHKAADQGHNEAAQLLQSIVKLEEKWTFQAGDALSSSPVVDPANGTIYFGCEDNNVYALDGAHGRKKWEFKTAGKVRSSPSIGTDGTVYIGSDDNKTYALDGATGITKWTFKTEGSVISSPAIGKDGTVYIGSDDNKVYALNGNTGAKIWEFETGNWVRSSPAIGADGTVYVGAKDNYVYALDGKSGVKIWAFETKGVIEASPAIGKDGTIYISSMDHKVYALNGKTGAKIWDRKLGQWVGESAVIDTNGLVYLGTGEAPGEGRFYVLDGKTGIIRQVFKNGVGTALAAPAIGYNGTICVGSLAGKLHVYENIANRKAGLNSITQSPWSARGQNSRRQGRAP